MITSRDGKIQRFIGDFNVVKTSQLKQLFFSKSSMRRCRQRLSILVNDFQRLKRERLNVCSEYIYYIDKKPKEIEHMLLRVDAYIKLNRDYILSEFDTEYDFDNIRPDAYFEIWQNGITTGYFLEIQLGNYFNQGKYERAYKNGMWIDMWDIFPSVIVVTDHRISFKPSQINYVRINQNDPKIRLEPF